MLLDAHRLLSCQQTQAGQLCVKITLPPVPVKFHKFMRCITNVIDLFLNDYYSNFLVIDKDVAFVCILSAFLWRKSE